MKRRTTWAPHDQPVIRAPGEMRDKAILDLAGITHIEWA